MKSFQILSLYTAAGFFSGIGLLYPWFWIIGIAGVTLWVWLLVSEQTWQQKYIGTYVAWTVKSLCATAFFWSVYPIDWLPFEISELSIFLIGITWLFVSASLGMGGLFLVGTLHVCRYLGWIPQSRVAFVLPFIWVLAEMIGAYSFSIYSFGPGGEINSLFSFGYIGYLVAQHNVLLQAASVLGVYGLIVLTISLALGFCYFINRKLWVVLGSIVVVLIVTSVLPISSKTDTQTVSVAVITSTYPVQDLFSREGQSGLQKAQQQAFSAAIELDTDYVLWPEDARFVNQVAGIDRAVSAVDFQYAESDTIVVDSSRIPYKDASILQALVYDMETGDYVLSHKRYLVPQGEFVPYVNEFILRGLGLEKLIGELNALVSYRVGPKTSQSDFRSDYPSILFCFEGIAPTGVRQLMQERDDVPFIAHPVSHSWFHEPNEVWHQLDASLKVQAVWNDIAIVSPASHAISKVYLPNGEIKIPQAVVVGDFFEVAVVTVPVQ